MASGELCWKLEKIPVEHSHTIPLTTYLAQGQDSKMVVAATACLDNSGLKMGQAMRLQKKGPLIADMAMFEIITVRTSFCLCFYPPHSPSSITHSEYYSPSQCDTHSARVRLSRNE